MSIDELLDRSIDSESDVRQFFEALKSAGFIFHPDDLAESYVDSSGARTFNDEQATRFDELMVECFEVLDDSHPDGHDIYRVAIEVFDPEALIEA